LSIMTDHLAALETQTLDLTIGAPLLEAHGLAVSYTGGKEDVRILEGLDFEVREREFISLVGPSGVGKTTLLRCLSGQIPAADGQVVVDGTPISAPHPDVAVVFQDYARSLLPWMRAWDNVAFPLQGRGVAKAERRSIAEKALERVGLAGKGELYPWEMSGGMQQRVAIARALAYNARVLLMDEPFASVDAQTRFDLEDLVLELRSKLGVTVVLVTHDIDEALYLSDRVFVLQGRPATVVDVVDEDFGLARDQLSTKADPRFAEARARILARLRKSRFFSPRPHDFPRGAAIWFFPGTVPPVPVASRDFCVRTPWGAVRGDGRWGNGARIRPVRVALGQGIERRWTAHGQHRGPAAWAVHGSGGDARREGVRAGHPAGHETTRAPSARTRGRAVLGSRSR
jgi:NitT/TauT family transport system ATP-binding protein